MRTNKKDNKKATRYANTGWPNILLQATAHYNMP
nr:MAG TPA: hypothetical protein [Caudoviricetes sp.]DAY23368.1 MAG TPA: hypothetical protein [Caudoviricetes sp.]